ncbi:hypothetical protein RHGRI_003299 [Rhododendron griersonianum]|uniref:Uncharacterized protein n=1 Tax=Rhododendron griersonianum TaxID=479676 RepID=A0AAV6L5N0_9ERIC|nr:hypothetical protein RHGRI_003299 [Rhododendron griersonianum]
MGESGVNPGVDEVNQAHDITDLVGVSTDMVVHSINHEGDISLYRKELVKGVSSLVSEQVGDIGSASNKFTVLQDTSGTLEEDQAFLPSVEEFDAGMIQDLVSVDILPVKALWIEDCYGKILGPCIRVILPVLGFRWVISILFDSALKG